MPIPRRNIRQMFRDATTTAPHQSPRTHDPETGNISIIAGDAGPSGQRIVIHDDTLSAEQIADIVTESNEPLSPQKAVMARDMLIHYLTYDRTALFKHGLFDDMLNRRNHSMETVVGLADHLLRKLRLAEIVIWRTDLWNAAVAGADVLHDWVPDLEALQTIPQLWFWEEDMPSFDPRQYDAADDYPLFLEALLVHTMRSVDGRIGLTGDGVYAVDVKMALDQGAMFSVDMRLPRFYGTTRVLPERMIGGGEQPYVFLAAKLFLEQKLVATPQVHLPRAERRRRQSERRDIPTIRRVILRKKETQSKAEDEGTPGSREYRYSWIVDPYWRMQPYGPQHSLRRPQMVNLEGHVKGDPNKPLKLKTVKPEKVNIVSR